MDMFQFLAVEGINCGGVTLPFKLVYIVHMIILLIEFGVPLLLIIFGMLDLGKAVIASKEDEIKKGQKTFISRLIAAIIVFFIIAVVKLAVGIAADDSKTITGCIDSIVNYKGDAQGNGYTANANQANE